MIVIVEGGGNWPSLPQTHTIKPLRALSLSVITFDKKREKEGKRKKTQQKKKKKKKKKKKRRKKRRHAA